MKKRKKQNKFRINDKIEIDLYCIEIDESVEESYFFNGRSGHGQIAKLI